jgi:hypothetical protein
MPNAKKAYWKFFNTFGRIIGVGFILWGLIFVLSGVTQRDGLIIIMGLATSALGVLLVLARPYQPGDSSSTPSDKR